jgi:rhodanese-related sulfurtransferase
MTRTLPLLLALVLLAGCSVFRRGERPPYRKLSAPVAYEIMRDNPDMLIIDLRSPREFNGNTGHLRRAKNIPLERLPFRLLEISTFRDETFLVYCDTDECAKAGMEVLTSSGFDNAVLMDGGIDSWINGGFKTVLPAEAAGRPGANGKEAPTRPLRPDEEPGEKTVKPSPPPPAMVAAPRQIG